MGSLEALEKQYSEGLGEDVELNADINKAFIPVEKNVLSFPQGKAKPLQSQNKYQQPQSPNKQQLYQ